MMIMMVLVVVILLCCSCCAAAYYTGMFDSMLGGGGAPPAPPAPLDPALGDAAAAAAGAADPAAAGTAEESSNKPSSDNKPREPKPKNDVSNGYYTIKMAGGQALAATTSCSTKHPKMGSGASPNYTWQLTKVGSSNEYRIESAIRQGESYKSADYDGPSSCDNPETTLASSSCTGLVSLVDQKPSSKSKLWKVYSDGGDQIVFKNSECNKYIYTSTDGQLSLSSTKRTKFKLGAPFVHKNSKTGKACSAFKPGSGTKPYSLRLKVGSVSNCPTGTIDTGCGVDPTGKAIDGTYASRRQCRAK
jgi:hypothetical protein